MITVFILSLKWDILRMHVSLGFLCVRRICHLEHCIRIITDTGYALIFKTSRKHVVWITLSSTLLNLFWMHVSSFPVYPILAPRWTDELFRKNIFLLSSFLQTSMRISLSYVIFNWKSCSERDPVLSEYYIVIRILTHLCYVSGYNRNEY